MPTPTKGRRLGGSPTHQRLMLANLATALFEHGRLTTTEAKARRLRPVAERLITFAKRGDLHARRQVLSVVRDKGVVHTLFTEIGPRFVARQGGYTRITKIGPRKGDNAPMVVIELVEAQTVAQQAVGEGERARRTRFVRGSRNDARPAAAAAQERTTGDTGPSAGTRSAGGATAVSAGAVTSEGDTMATDTASPDAGSTDAASASDTESDAVRNAQTYSENEAVEPMDTAAPVDVLEPAEVAELNAGSVESAGTPADDAAIAAASDQADTGTTADDAPHDEPGR